MTQSQRAVYIQEDKVLPADCVVFMMRMNGIY